MKNTQLRRLYYNIRHRYFTMNNVVVVVALLIAAGWAWGSVQAMERNYALQKQVDAKQRQLLLTQLETDKLKFEQRYYQSDEYKELAARERLGLVQPGEKVLILPANSKAASAADLPKDEELLPAAVEPSNLQQWLNFLLGGTSARLQE